MAVALTTLPALAETNNAGVLRLCPNGTAVLAADRAAHDAATDGSDSDIYVHAGEAYLTCAKTTTDPYTHEYAALRASAYLFMAAPTDPEAVSIARNLAVAVLKQTKFAQIKTYAKSIIKLMDRGTRFD